MILTLILIVAAFALGIAFPLIPVVNKAIPTKIRHWMGRKLLFDEPIKTSQSALGDN
jgi:hypothetical protein